MDGGVIVEVATPSEFSFDVAGQPRVYLPGVANSHKPGECCGATVGYDPGAAADARRRVAEFFGYHLRAQ